MTCRHAAGIAWQTNALVEFVGSGMNACWERILIDTRLQDLGVHAGDLKLLFQACSNARSIIMSQTMKCTMMDTML
jgi:hypothetical protein